MPREASNKTREWEKHRRDRLNNTFVTLSKLLPCYDPSRTLSKIDILIKAASYIEELQKKVKDALTTDGVKQTKQDEVKRFCERIKKLLLRNEQLSNLLKDAGIKIPNDYGSVKHFKGSLRWANTINAAQAKDLAKKEAQREKEKENRANCKASKTKGVKRNSVNVAIKHRNGVRRSTRKFAALKKNSGMSVISIQIPTVLPTLPPASLIANTRPCYIITSAPSTNPSVSTNINGTTPTDVTSLLSTPRVTSTIKPSTTAVIAKSNTTLSRLGPGTLILANGSIVPLLPQPTVLPSQTVLTTPTPMFLKQPSPTNTTLIVLPNNTSSKENTANNFSIASNISNTSKTLPRLRPKLGVTRTTQVNKVPIPALTSSYSKNVLASTLKQAEGVKSKCKPKKKVAAQVSGKNKAETKSTETSIKKPEKRKLPSTIDQIKRRKKENVSDEKPATEQKSKEVASPSQEKCVESTPAVDSSAAIADPAHVEKELTLNGNGLNESGVNMTISNNDGPTKDLPDSIPNCEENVLSLDENRGEKTTVSLGKVDESIDLPAPSSKSSGEPETSASSVPTKPAETIGSIDTNVIEHQKEEIDMTDVPLATAESTSLPNNRKVQEDESHVQEKPVVVEKQTESSEILKTSEEEAKNLDLGINLNHSELSNDIFSSLQVPIGGQNPESTSPTAAFLLAFPLVSTLTGVKVTEVIEEDNSESRHGTPTLLQIGTMDTTKTTQSLHSDSLTPSLLNLDNFSFFSSKDICSNYYPSFDNLPGIGIAPVTAVSTSIMESYSNEKISRNTEVTLPNTKNVKEEAQIQNLPVSKATSSVAVKGIPNASKNITAPAVPSYSNMTYSQVKPTITQNNFQPQCAAPVFPKTTPFANQPVYASSHKQLGVTSSSKENVGGNYGVSIASKPNFEQKPAVPQYTMASTNMFTVTQCNTFNPFADFSKSTPQNNFTKSYTDPLYTNSYSYQNDNNFAQNSCYTMKPALKNVPQNTTMYEVPYGQDCKNGDVTKRELRQSSTNYYPQGKQHTKDKFVNLPPKGVKVGNNHPKPPVNWMTMPDFRQQSTSSEYVMPSFGKDFDYASNSFYSSTSFATGTHTTYFNTTPSVYSATEFQNTIADGRKQLDSTFPIIPANTMQRNECDENQFSWSPTKLPQFLDNSHTFVSSTLPTLVGDLALGTTQPTYTDQQKLDGASAKELKTRETNRKAKVHAAGNFDNQNTFLSVSQLVDNKNEGVPARPMNRRNSGNRNGKNTAHKTNKRGQKLTDNNKETPHAIVDNYNRVKIDMGAGKSEAVKLQPSGYNVQVNSDNGTNWMRDYKPNRHGNKNTHSNYSAESLISHQNQPDVSAVKQRYPQQVNYPANTKSLPIPTFLSDNIMPYFPPVELPQENSFTHQSNQNYQSGTLPPHNFTTSVQNNSYSASTITSSYLQTTSMMPEFASDFNQGLAENVNPFSHMSNKLSDNKNCNKPINNKLGTIVSQPNQADCSVHMMRNNFSKKASKKHASENLPGFVDFGFLPMSSTINSPILPDDFHTHSNFLPPPTPAQIYPCKNSLYGKQNSDLGSSGLLPLPPVPISKSGVQHFDGSPSVSSAGGSSLTNFNLSAIFPEINKGSSATSAVYPEGIRPKSYSYQKHYLGNTVQGVHVNKSTSATTYVNSTATLQTIAN